MSQNGHKHWLSGWFIDRMLTINPRTASQGIRLAGFVDYSNPGLQDEDYVLVRTGNLFIQFNLAESYNKDADEPNTVTITEAVGREEVSLRLAALREGESYSVYQGTTKILDVEVCSIQMNQNNNPSYAYISIHGDGDASHCIQQEITNSNSNVVPGGRAPPAPSNAPVRSPMRTPVSVPTIFIETGPVDIGTSPGASPTATDLATSLPTFLPRPMVPPSNPTASIWKANLAIIIPVAIGGGAFVCMCLIAGALLRFCRCRPCCTSSGSLSPSQKTHHSSTSDDSELSLHRPQTSSDKSSDYEEDDDWWAIGGEYLSDLGCGSR